MPMYYGEDMLFSLHAYQKTSNIYRIDEGIIIQYHDNAGSLTHADPNIFGVLLGIDLLPLTRYAYENHFDINVINQMLYDNLLHICHIDTEYVEFFFALSCLLGSCMAKYCPAAQQLY